MTIEQAKSELMQIYGALSPNKQIAIDTLVAASANPQEPKTGHCMDCKYFEYDSVVTADGIPLIVAHEICSKWGDGCKTREDGYCFLFEPQESEVRNEH